MIKTFRLTGPLRTLNNRQVRAPKGRRRAGGWSVLAWGKHSRRRSACRPVLQQNSGGLRGTLLVRSDDLLTFLGISAVRTRLGRSSRGEHEHYFRQLFRGGIPPEPTV